MTLQEILEDADSIAPNAYTNAQKVRWLNQIQRQLFRHYPLPEQLFELQIVPDVQFYPLPENCPEDRITSIVIDNQEYRFAVNDQPAPGRFWTMVAGQIFIHPKPTVEMTGIITCEPRYVALSESNLNAVPQFPEDFHELLVNGLAQRIAKRRKDAILANNAQADYNEILREADDYFRAKEPEEIVDELAGWWPV